MSPFHAFSVHFPIALVTLGFFYDLFSVFPGKNKGLKKTGYYLQSIAMLSAIIAWGSGYFSPGTLQGDALIQKDLHQHYASVFLVFLILSTLLRRLVMYLGKDHKPVAKYTVMGLYFIAFIFVFSAGITGTRLVYGFLT